MTYEKLISLPDGTVISYNCINEDNVYATHVSTLFTGEVYDCYKEKFIVQFYSSIIPLEGESELKFSSMSNIKVLPNYYQQFHPELFI